MKDWEWSFPDGKPDQGLPTTFTTETSDGYLIAVTLQQNEDGLIVCTGLNIDSVDKNFIDDLQKQLLEWDLQDNNLPGKKVQFAKDKDLISFKISDFT